MNEQYIVHDGDYIYGYGTNLIGLSQHADDLQTIYENAFDVQRCTVALALQVETEGGFITWCQINGTACTQAEYAEAK